MRSFHGNAKQENAHGHFAADAGEAVCDFTEPPVLCFVSLGWVQVQGRREWKLTSMAVTR